MRRLPTIVALTALALVCRAHADSPFPDTNQTHWVYASMIQIKKDHLWYRTNDNVPRRPVRTRGDFATKTLFLAIDSQSLINKFQQTTTMVSEPAYDAATKKWATQFRATFFKRKTIYQNYLRRVTKLWKYFRADIKPIAKKLKLDTKVITQNLALEKITLDGLRIPRPRSGRSR